MKNFKLLLILINFVSVFMYSSCKDDNPVTNNPNPPFVGGYSHTEAGECMTLAALSYVNQNNPSYLRDSLKIQLANTAYATGGNWILDWGPALNSDHSNMMYVVKDTSVTPDLYAIAIRGTDWCFPTDWEEDILVYDLVSYPYGSTTDSVSSGSLVGLNQLLAMTDSATGRTLTAYLNSIGNDDNYMYITGHSLGGALATIMTSWFLDNGHGNNFKLKSYTFAAPSVGNPSYVSHFQNLISQYGAESHRVINPKDLVPRFCAELDSVIYQQIPTALPLKVGGIIIAMEGYFLEYGIDYQHVGTRQTLASAIPLNCGNSGSLDDYECWVLFEHDHNLYLQLLNAPVTNFYYAGCDWSWTNH